MRAGGLPSGMPGSRAEQRGFQRRRLRLRHEHAAGRDAGGAGIETQPVGEAAGDEHQVGARKHEHRVVAGQLHGAGGEGPGGGGEHLAARLGGAGEDDAVEPGRRGVGTGALIEQLQHVGGQAGLVQPVLQRPGGGDPGRGRFEAHGVAGDDGLDSLRAGGGTAGSCRVPRMRTAPSGFAVDLGGDAEQPERAAARRRGVRRGACWRGVRGSAWPPAAAISRRRWCRRAAGRRWAAEGCGVAGHGTAGAADHRQTGGDGGGGPACGGVPGHGEGRADGGVDGQRDGRGDKIVHRPISSRVCCQPQRG